MFPKISAEEFALFAGETDETVSFNEDFAVNARLTNLQSRSVVIQRTSVF